MKKLLLILLCLTLVMSLAACGVTKTPSATAVPAATSEPAPEATPEPTAEPTPEPTSEPTPEPTPEPEPEAEPEPTEEPAAAVDEAQYEAALACVGRSVEELYAAVGTPTGGAQYAVSCLEENAEDGMLYYEGFYVWTVKNDSGETVHQVYLAQ